MYNVATTAIIFNDDNQVLLTKRSKSKNKWPGKWTVPGGRLEDVDFIGTPTAINNQWYHTLENSLRREVMEETGVKITDIQYLCNIAIPDTIIISYTARYAGGIIDPQPEEVEAYAWAWESDLDDFDLIDGIKEEIILAFYK
jgi:ADP-ribose pyrophosphatase YjhB (NUDIX family)